MQSMQDKTIKELAMDCHGFAPPFLPKETPGSVLNHPRGYRFSVHLFFQL